MLTPYLLRALSLGSWLVLLGLTTGLLVVIASALALPPAGGAMAAVASFYGIRSLVAWSHLRIVSALGKRYSAEKVVHIRALAPDVPIVLLPPAAGVVCESRWSGMGTPYVLIAESLITAEKVPPCLLHHLGHLQHAGYRLSVLVLIVSAGLLLSAVSSLASTAHWLTRAFAMGTAIMLAEAISTIAVSRREERRAEAWAMQQSEDPVPRDTPRASTVGGPAYYLCRATNVT